MAVGGNNMYYSDGYIGPQPYFPDIRSGKYVEVCANYILFEIIGSAPVKAIVHREGTDGGIEKLDQRLYKVSIPKKAQLKHIFLLSWLFSFCIVRLEIHGCLFDHELFGGSVSTDIEQLENTFYELGNAILNHGKFEVEGIQEALFLACPRKGARITTEIVTNTP